MRMKFGKQEVSTQRLIHVIQSTLGISIAIMCLFLLIFFVRFDSKSNHCNTTPQDIGYMQSVVSEIQNNIQNYEMSSQKLLNKSTESGQQDNYYYKGKSILKNQLFFGETGKVEISFYFKNNKVFYINEKDTEYISPIYEDSSGKPKHINTKEFYIDDKQNLCIWYLNKKVQENDPETESLIKSIISGF